jgi:hypothetical protein
MASCSEVPQVVVALPQKIGELARRPGLSVKTIRSEGGERLFGDAVLLQQAKHLQAPGARVIGD